MHSCMDQWILIKEKFLSECNKIIYVFINEIELGSKFYIKLNFLEVEQARYDRIKFPLKIISVVLKIFDYGNFIIIDKIKKSGRE